MKKNFRFGLAVFAMLLVSAACFAISPKDKKCEGAWLRTDDSSQGFYFKDGNVYVIFEGMWFDYEKYDPLKMVVRDDYFRVYTGPDYETYTIESVDGSKMTIKDEPYGFEDETPRIYTYKKASEIPPKAAKGIFEY